MIRRTSSSVCVLPDEEASTVRKTIAMTEGGGPTLYTNKPNKSQLKKHLPPPPPASVSSSSMAFKASSSFSTPPPQPPKESFIRRYKFVWPLLLAVNLAVGGYVLIRTKKKEAGMEGEVPAVTSSTSATATVTASVVEKSTAPVTIEPLKLREPIPEDQQRELFKWILEEKRKVKTKDPVEKKHIDEEKAIIKQFLRAKTIPPL